MTPTIIEYRDRAPGDVMIVSMPLGRFPLPGWTVFYQDPLSANVIWYRTITTFGDEAPLNHRGILVVRTKPVEDD